MTKSESKTFADPITMRRINKDNGILLDTKWYSKDAMYEWACSGTPTVPHSRRHLTDQELHTVCNGRALATLELDFPEIEDEGFAPELEFDEHGRTDLLDLYPIDVRDIHFDTDDFDDFINSVGDYIMTNKLGGVGFSLVGPNKHQIVLADVRGKEDYTDLVISIEVI